MELGELVCVWYVLRVYGMCVQYVCYMCCVYSVCVWCVCAYVVDVSVCGVCSPVYLLIEVERMQLEQLSAQYLWAVYCYT